MFGIHGIMVKVIDCKDDDVKDLNQFLDEYDGNIIDIKTVPMLYGITRYVVIYKGVNAE